jgi:hypothetical protein
MAIMSILRGHHTHCGSLRNKCGGKSPNVPNGKPFRLPNTVTVFYGTSIGHWIFEWAFRFISDEVVVFTDLQFLDSIHRIERHLHILVHAERDWIKNENGAL